MEASLTFILFVLLGLSPVTAVAQAQRPAQSRATTPAPVPAAPSLQIDFKCPVAGVVVETTTGMQIRDSTRLGHAPSDPTLCLAKSGFTTSEMYYGRFSNNISPEGLSELRRGFADLFSGAKSEFTVRYQTAASSGGRFLYEVTWQRVGRDLLVLGGRSMNTVTFNESARNLDGSWKGVANWWYDPETGVWVKRQVLKTPGMNWGDDWHVTKIVFPG